MIKSYKIFEAELKTIQSKDMTGWGTTEPLKEIKKLDEKYLDQIFADFIDRGSKSDVEYINQTSESEGIICEYEIEIPTINKDNNSIESFIKYTEELSELALDVKSCIDKVMDEYPYVKVEFGKYADECYMLTINNSHNLYGF